MNFLGNGVLHCAQPIKPAIFLLLGGGVVHGSGRGAGTGGEDEGEQAVVVYLLDKGNGLLKFVLGFSGEAHDDIRGQHQIGHDFFRVGYLVQIGFPVIVPVHGF